MLEQAFAVSGCVTVALVGLVASNLLYDRGVTNSLSRYVAPILGGVAFLVAVLWLDIWTATVLSCAMALFILAVRLGFRRGLRGVEGNLPTQAWAEVTYAMGGTASLAAGWGVLGDRWLAFLPIAFMAWGDSAAGASEGHHLARHCGQHMALGSDAWRLPCCCSILPALLDWRPRGSRS